MIRVLTYLLLVSFGTIAQPIVIEAEGLKHFISDTKDSVYLQGLENGLRIEWSLSEGPFQYRLSGYDKNWKTSKYPVAAYTNLPGGSYSLEFKSNTMDRPPIKIEVMEALWQKWWFWPMIIAYIALLVAVGSFLFFQYNFRQKLKIEHIRNRIASDLHDEVGSNLSSIAIYTEVLRKKLSEENKDLLPLLDKITGNSKESVGLMQDTVWALNPMNDGSERLIERIISFGKEILTAKGIGFSHKVSINSFDIKLDMEERKNCYMIIKEALNNAAKHSGATSVKLEISEVDHRILFSLKDNGKGFNPNQENTGNGLRNYAERAKDSDFEIIIDSQPGKGTEIKLYIN